MTESGIYSTWPAKFQSWFYLFILKVSNILKKKIIKKRVMKSVRWLRQKKKKRDERLTPMSLTILYPSLPISLPCSKQDWLKKWKDNVYRNILSTTKSFEYFPNGLLLSSNDLSTFS